MARMSRMSRMVPVALVALATVSGMAVPAAPPASADVQPVTSFGRAVRDSGHAAGVLSAFAALPSDALLTAGKDGRVVWVAPDDSEHRTLGRIGVRDVGHSGLVALEPAPDYASTGTVFTVYAYNDEQGVGRQRLSEWRVDDPASPTALVQERSIVDGIPVGADDVHGAADVVADPDGSLWLTIGDGAAERQVGPDALRAQDLDQPHGKLLHVTRSGDGLPDNAFYDAADPDSWRSRVYAYGFRNPGRMTLHPASGVPVVGDEGWRFDHEVNVVRPGGNYGWPCWSGQAPAPGYESLAECAGLRHEPPAFADTFDVPSTMVGGIFQSGGTWPERFAGRYLFGSTNRLVHALTVDAAGTATSEGSLLYPRGAPAYPSRPVQLRPASNGDVLYADGGTGEVIRLFPVAGNRAPVARVTTRTDPSTRTVHFDARASSDADGDDLSWSWDFGDSSTGGTTSGGVVDHVYPPGDTFRAVLTLTDGRGAAVRHVVDVSPGNWAPAVDLHPASGSASGPFRVGDAVSLTAAGVDPEDGDLEVTWHATVLRCADDGDWCFASAASTRRGPTFSTRFDDYGGNTHLVVRASVTDSTGVTSSSAFVAKPDLRWVKVVTGWAGRLTTVNGTTSDGDEHQAYWQTVVGSTNSVTVPAVAGVDGIAHFASWENGSKSRIHPVAVGAENLTVTAAYSTPIDRRHASDPALRSFLGAPVAPEQHKHFSLTRSADGPWTNLHWRDYEKGRLYWNATTGYRVLGRSIRDAFDRIGGHDTYSLPLIDERRTPDGSGSYVHLNDDTSIYWSQQTGAQVVSGEIRERWASLGWERGPLGYPMTSARTTPDGFGRYVHFTKGASIYWTPQTGAQAVWGAIRTRWAESGWERGLGYPFTTETPTPDGAGRYVHFTNSSSVYWSPWTGAHAIGGSIRQRWASLGYERGPLGYPVTSEMVTPDRVGRYNHFSGGASVYWTPSTGAHEVRDRIRDRWAALGWERSYLGYPVTGQYNAAGRRNDFQHGYIHATLNQVTDRRY